VILPQIAIFGLLSRVSMSQAYRSLWG